MGVAVQSVADAEKSLKQSFINYMKSIGKDTLHMEIDASRADDVLVLRTTESKKIEKISLGSYLDQEFKENDSVQVEIGSRRGDTLKLRITESKNI